MEHLATVIEDDPVLGRLVRAIKDGDRQQMAFGLAAFGIQLLDDERATDAILRTYIGMAKERLKTQLRALEEAERQEVERMTERRIKKQQKEAEAVA